MKNIFNAMTDRDLSLEQWNIVRHIDGALLVVAGAGSGKTAVLTARIANLVNSGINPSKIVAVTFTNKAASEMRSRIKMLSAKDVLVSTFHGLGLQILKKAVQMGFCAPISIVYDAQDSEKLIEEICKQEGVTINKQMAHKLISAVKSAGELNLKKAIYSKYNDGDLDFAPDTLYEMIIKYDKRLQEVGAVDFDDLIRRPLQLLHDNKEFLHFLRREWLYFSIDEYQDTNLQQALLIKMLAGESENVCAVGDPDQAIYSWRGADISNILNFSRLYSAAKVYMLNVNYRCPGLVVDWANSVISKNQQRIDRVVISGKKSLGEAKIIYVANEMDEAFSVVHYVKQFMRRGDLSGDCVVLYRANFQSRVFEDVFMQMGVKYKIYGGISFYQRREIKDVVAFLRVAVNNLDLVSFMRSTSLFKMGLGSVTIQKIIALANSENKGVIAWLWQKYSDSTLPFKLNPTNNEKLGVYLDKIMSIKRLLDNNQLADAVKQIVLDINVRNLILQEDEKDSKQEERFANLKELISKASQWEGVGVDRFLEEMALRSSDEDAESEAGVALMTIHNAKGLEYKNVFIVGLEEGLFPYTNSSTRDVNIEEERRLCYVGITRATKTLMLFSAQERFLWGRKIEREPSRFLVSLQ